MFSYDYHPVFAILESAHLQLYIVNINGTLNKTIDIGDCNIYYSDSIDENNVIFSIHYREFLGNDYGQCVGLYNLETNNFTIILANCNYSIDQLSYNPIENKIMINCRENNTIFIRKFNYQPEDYNGNGFADNIEDFPDRDPTAPLSIHNEDAKEKEKESDDSDIQICFIGNMFLIQIIIILAIAILILIIVIFFLKKDKGKKKKQYPESEEVKFIEV